MGSEEAEEHADMNYVEKKSTQYVTFVGNALHSPSENLAHGEC